jgi:predicted DNA-binding transcriptional regulator YafY
MNRFDRITAILIQLQSKKVVKAQDLAERFGISLRTVYRDIRTLEEAGVPLYGEAGVGYSLVDGYRLPPVMFTPEEAMAFVTAEKLMERFTDAALQQNYTSAMYKVKAVLRGSEKDMVANLEELIEVKDKKRNKNFPTNTLDVLLKAIAEKKAVEMEYRAFGNDENSRRLIEPIGIFHENENWYTIGFCHLRDEYRQFRIDRVRAIKLTHIAQKERETLKEYRHKEQLKHMHCLKKAVICVDKNIAMYLQERRHFFGFVAEEEKESCIEMTFLTASLEEGLARWVLSFADYAEVKEPQELKDRILELAQKVTCKMAAAGTIVG